MLPLLLVVLGALATARLTRLATADYLTLSLRRRVLQAVREGGRAEYLLSCRWCASVWIGAGVAVPVTAQLGLAGTAERALAWGLLTLAYSHTTGLLAAREVEA